MLSVIEHLLVLQDRDRKISRVKAELDNIPPERASLERRGAETQGRLDAAKLKAKQIETERKKLELEVESKKQQIEKYALQQFQTKKNEEYRALAHEIENCKETIGKLEDQQLEFMEQADVAQKEIAEASKQATQAKQHVQDSLAALASREQSLRKQLTDLEADYSQLEGAVDESVLTRYERLRRQKGGNTVVGIDHSVCGGCHMKLPTQIVISCQGQAELISCPNCGRILYYTREMDLAVQD